MHYFLGFNAWSSSVVSLARAKPSGEHGPRGCARYTAEVEVLVASSGLMVSGTADVEVANEGSMGEAIQVRFSFFVAAKAA